MYKTKNNAAPNISSNKQVGVWQKVAIDLPEFSLGDLYDESKEFSKEDLIGKYSLLNFFASWCTTCLSEHPALMRLKDNGKLAIYGIAWRDIDKKTQEYLARNGNPFTKIGVDSKGLFTKILHINAVPESFLINPQGKIIARFSGNIEDESEVEKLIKN